VGYVVLQRKKTNLRNFYSKTGKVPLLVELLKKHFGGKIYTPPMYYENNSKWPSTIDAMVQGGKQILFMSGIA
jgi:hypothetical protein